jgi:RNA polymerase sigma-70 factor (ECF subfamily)
MFRHDPLADPERLIRRVYAYVAYRLGDGPDAEDVTSDTFERALRYRRTYDPRQGEPAAWLIGIARRRIAESYGTRLLTTADLPEETTAEELEERIAGRLDLRTAVACLEERDRELIALRFGADLTARQIAELLASTTNAVEVALHRALSRLRAVLERDADTGDVTVAPGHEHQTIRVGGGLVKETAA